MFGIVCSQGIAGGPVITGVPVDHVYAPKGFDTNDNTQIIVSGFLPNLCYKSPRSKVEIQGNTINIHMESMYWEIMDVDCVQVIVPYLEVVSLGNLNAGTYDIRVNEETPFALKDQIEVTQATQLTIDDHIYAGVQYVDTKENSRKITLNGMNPGNCLVLDHIEFIQNGKDTYSVLPILKKISEMCTKNMVSFSYETEVPADLKEKNLLLHVRIMQGDSVNTLFNNESRARKNQAKQ